MMIYRGATLFLSSAALLVVLANANDKALHPLHRRLEIINESGENLAVDWINPRDGKPQPFRQTNDGDRLALDSFVNHTFVFRPKNVAPSTCGDEQQDSNNNNNNNNKEDCKVIGKFTVSENSTTQVVFINEGPQLNVIRLDDELSQAPPKRNQVATDLIFKCRINSDTALDTGAPPKKVLKELYECLETETALAIEHLSEELGFQAEMRLKLANEMENKTCADPNAETTTPKEIKTWTHNGVDRKVGILHDRPSSQIHILHDFISREECDAVEAAAKPALHRGTVADGKGGSTLSQNRKAWQAGIAVDWSKETAGDPIAAVTRRLFDYANHVTGYNMKVEGQEDLMSIQYFGNGTDDPTPDRYTPHCDGECDGLPHKKGARVATMVMYCDVPELGGGTNFQNANVFAKPQQGAAAFFSYMDPKTGDHETGFTSHSGCPVLLGTKRIAVQWMRVGVDTENPWDSFDTNTISRKLKEDLTLIKKDTKKRHGDRDLVEDDSEDWEDEEWDHDEDDDDFHEEELDEAATGWGDDDYFKDDEE